MGRFPGWALTLLLAAGALAQAPIFRTDVRLVRLLVNVKDANGGMVGSLEKDAFDVVDSGGKVTQETRLYNSNEGKTYSMRSKEQAHDYRYFPEPDLLPLVVDEKWMAKITKTLPELPETRRARMVKDYGISEYDAQVLTFSKSLADQFESAAKAEADGLDRTSSRSVGARTRGPRRRTFRSDRTPGAGGAGPGGVGRDERGASGGAGAAGDGRAVL